MNLIILLSLFLEVAVLSFLEYKTWKSIYTPLFLLIYPYLLVLIITIAMAGKMDFVEFYYPSIIYWIVGLALFAIPSILLGYTVRKSGFRVESMSLPTEETMPKILLYLALSLSLLFLYRLKQMWGDPTMMVGSDDFAFEYSGAGLWAHLRAMLTLLLIMTIYFINKKQWWLIPLAIVMLGIVFLNQVKGAILIALIAGLLLRIYTGRTKLSFRILLYTLIGGVVVFFGSYILSLVVAGSGEMNNHIMTFISRHFLHYLTSGTLGLSVDAYNGFPMEKNFQMLITQFVNICKVIVGDGEMLSPINPLYYNTGNSITNVRTFFGTIFVNSNWIEFVLITLVWSSIIYLVKIVTHYSRSIYIYVIYFYLCTLLCMGWFDYYLFHLSVVEIPVMALLFMLLVKILRKPETHYEVA